MNAGAGKGNHARIQTRAHADTGASQDINDCFLPSILSFLPYILVLTALSERRAKSNRPQQALPVAGAEALTMTSDRDHPHAALPAS
mmetsp:Transcript_93109/g.289700  ORF Transcript_93109/g.289700 Transcript_93109/m.289700 type:complete len:87 (-) Transcript_93109:1121-1381(-)